MNFLKKPLFLAILSGLLFITSWPVGGFSIFIFVALVPILMLEHYISISYIKRKKSSVFGYGFLTFFIWNIGATWWIVNASAFGMAFAVFCNSLFYTLLLMFFHWSKKRLPLRSAYVFLISIWLAFEKLHLQWDFSWPWLNLGNVFSENIHWIQWYEYTGTFGGSLWILILNIGILEVIKKNTPWDNGKKFIRELSPWLIAIVIPVIFSIIIFSKHEIKTPTIEVLLVQPNIDPYTEKYGKTNLEFLNLLSSMTQGEINENTDYVFAPETYFASGYGELISEFKSSELQESIQEFLKPHPKVQLISGIQFYNIYRTKTEPSPTANEVKKDVWVDFYNSALKIEYQSKPEYYHKSKLVVGVENMPYKSILKPILGDFMLDLGGTVSSRATQKERSVFEHSKLKTKVAPIICYESIYGAFVTEYVRKGANFLGVITNDAWWGDTQGHKQLLSYARLRAIENRRAVVRSANTGISAIINSRGEITARLPFNEKGVLKSKVTSKTEITFYTQYGDYIARWAGFISVLYFLIAVSGRLKQK